MGDHYPVDIKVGGVLTAAKLKAFVTAVDQDGSAEPDWGEEVLNLGGIRAHVLAAASARPPTYVRFHATNGDSDSFEQTRKACRRLGLTFVEHADPFDGEDAWNSWWAPGMPGEEGGYSTVDGKALVEVKAVRGVLEFGIERVREYLDQATPPEVPPVVIAKG